MAARQLIRALDTYWPQPPAGVHWLCNGPATADILRQAGLEPQFPGSGHTAEDVLSLPATEAVTGSKWLVVKGGGGRDVYPHELEHRGAQVTALEAYDRALEAEVLGDINQCAPGVDAVLVSSLLLGEALVNGVWREWPGIWILTSPRLLEWARKQGLRHCLLAKGASPDAVSQAIKAVVDKVDR
jgi:uroporphyrinogen-III synthase